MTAFDPFPGIYEIANEVLHCVGERFSLEDGFVNRIPSLYRIGVRRSEYAIGSLSSPNEKDHGAGGLS